MSTPEARCVGDLNGIENSPFGNPTKLIPMTAAQADWLDSLPLDENQVTDHAADLVVAWDEASDHQDKQVGCVIAADRATGDSSITYLAHAVLVALGYPDGLPRQETPT